MLSYAPQMALVASFLCVIVLHAWFTRRLIRLRDEALAERKEYERLRSDVLALSEEVVEFKRGMETNAVATKALEKEIEDWQRKIDSYVPESEDAAF